MNIDTGTLPSWEQVCEALFEKAIWQERQAVLSFVRELCEEHPYAVSGRHVTRSIIESCRPHLKTGVEILRNRTTGGYFATSTQVHSALWEDVAVIRHGPVRYHTAEHRLLCNIQSEGEREIHELTPLHMIVLMIYIDAGGVAITDNQLDVKLGEHDAEHRSRQAIYNCRSAINKVLEQCSPAMQIGPDNPRSRGYRLVLQ